MTHTNPQEAFNKAIKAGILSEDRTAANYAGNFMYMHTKYGNDYFKHCTTRKYCSTKNGAMRAARFEPLTMYEYEVNCPFTHEYVIDRMRLLYGDAVVEMDEDIKDMDLPLPEDMTHRDWTDLGDYLDDIITDKAIERHRSR